MVDYSKWNHLDEYDSDYGETENGTEQLVKSVDLLDSFVVATKKPQLPSSYDGSPLQRKQYQDAWRIHCKYFEDSVLEFDPKIQIHSSDHVAQIHPIFFSNPELFPPLVGEGHQHIIWGLQDLYRDYFALHLRRMTTQFLYQTKTATPEPIEFEPAVQFINALAYKKECEIIQYRLKQQGKPKDYILDIVVSDITPRIWRRVSISSAMPLHVFQDKVVCPVLGWLRNYHSYIFTDAKDGSQFGPKECSASDYSHLPLNGYVVIDDSKFTIGDLLRKKNDIMYYSYDLGDHFEHIIRLTAIRPAKESTGKCVVLGGAMAPLPEDSYGLHDQKGNSGYQALLNQWKSSPQKKRDAISKEISQAVNYLARGEIFDPFKFDVEECQGQVLKALKSHTSLRNGCKQVAFPTPTSLPPPDSIIINRNGTTKEIIQPINGGKQFLKETCSSVRDRKSDTVCICGNPYRLRTCGNCKMIWYCGMVLSINVGMSTKSLERASICL